MGVKGLNNILNNLNAEVAKIENGSAEGLRKATLFVEDESNEIVPQDKGVLINSSFSGVSRLANKVIGRIGYTAKYAPHVHEMPASFNYTKIGTGPKFLEKAVKNNFNNILKIIQGEAKVK
jgi:hypothetical protein